MKTLQAVAAAVLGFAALTVHDSAAAQDRSELIRQARAQPSDSLALDLLLRAANPAEAPPDSLWAVSVHDLALTLIGIGNESSASVWLRWSARHGPGLPVDRSLPPMVVTAYDQAVSAVESGGGLGDPGVATSWRWPEAFDVAASGVLAVSNADPVAEVTVSVEGRGSVAAGEELILPPGTYQLVASAEGYETVRLDREILPGATTVLEFDLALVLPEAARTIAMRALVNIRYTSGGQDVCTTGFMGRPDGFVLTSRSALGGESGLEVTTATGVFTNVSVARSDPALDLAVLRLNLTGQPTLAPASGVSGQDVWSVFHQGCQEPTSAHARLGDWPSPPTSVIRMAASLSPEAVGGPLFDESGRLIGVVVGPDQIVPGNLAESLLARAFADVESSGTQISGGGGPPWKWIGAGVVAAGAAALLLGGGGGGDVAAPTTGSITVTFPGGLP